MFSSGWPKVRRGPTPRAIAFADDVAAQAADRLDDLLARLRVAARRVLHRGLVLLAVGEQIGDDRVDLDLVADRVLRRAVVRVVPERAASRSSA